MDGRIRFVIDTFNRMVADDGGAIEVVGVDGATLQLRYERSDGGGCDSCVLEPEDLRQLVTEALRAQRVPVDDVVLVP